MGQTNKPSSSNSDSIVLDSSANQARSKQTESQLPGSQLPRSQSTGSISWRESILIYRQKPALVMILLGFAAGLPLLLVFSTMTAWLRDVGIEKTAIGFFAWVGITYSIKVIWAPVVDRFRWPLLFALFGQRRSWIIIAQAVIAMGLLILAQLNPEQSLLWIAMVAVMIAFASATQDIAIDAFRIESAVGEHQGALSAAYILGYRLALLVAGAGALYLADHFNWLLSYSTMGGLMAACILATLWASEPSNRSPDQRLDWDAQMIDRIMGRPMNMASRPLWQRHFLGAVVCPFLEFFQRNGRLALIILLFISLFRISDITMGIMANPFYLDLGFSKSDIASIAKVFGFFMTIIGSAFCGVMVVKFGIMRPLLVGAILVAATNGLFAVMAWQAGIDIGHLVTPSLIWLALVISADNLSGGIASTAFIAYLSSLTNRQYTATQYALFSSLMTLPGKFLSGFSGWVIDGSSYTLFFVIAAILGLPAIFLVIYLNRISLIKPD